MGSETEANIIWNKTTEENFQKILLEIPDMIRGIAETRISKKAQSIVRDENRSEITEKDMVAALFAETPEGFIPATRKFLTLLGISSLLHRERNF